MPFIVKYKNLESLQEKLSNVEADSEVEVTVRMAILEVKSIFPLNMGQPGSYQNDPRVKMLSQTSGIEIA